MVLTEDERVGISKAIEEDINRIRGGGYNEILIKQQFLDHVKETFGNDWRINDFTKKHERYHDFREPNIISISNNETELILYFHESKFHSNETAFYGFNKRIIEDVIDYIKTNLERKIYFYLYLMLDTGKTILNFALPIFIIKNNENDVSISEEGQYKLNIINKKDKYYLRLKNNPNEDLAGFMKNVDRIFEKELIEKYYKEQEKFFEKKHAQEELLKNLRLKNRN